MVTKEKSDHALIIVIELTTVVHVVSDLLKRG